MHSIADLAYYLAMKVIKVIWNSVIDALFPLSPAEANVLSMSPERALAEIPRAPAPPIEHARSVFTYKDERAEKLVWNIKYKRVKSSIDIAAFALCREIDMTSSAPVFVIPMPMTAKRMKERGFNQTELVAEAMKHFATSPSFTVAAKILLRIHHSSRQTLKSRNERIASAKGIFKVDTDALATLEATADSRFIVIDDVITTGSTMKEALDTLKAAGIQNVRGISIAH